MTGLLDSVNQVAGGAITVTIAGRTPEPLVRPEDGAVVTCGGNPCPTTQELFAWVADADHMDVTVTLAKDNGAFIYNRAEFTSP